MMSILIADRFVCTQLPALDRPGEIVRVRALDLARGETVCLQFSAAGSRVEQQAWIEACAAAHLAGALVDFGFLGAVSRFEAVWPGGNRRAAPLPGTDASVLDWLAGPVPGWRRVVHLDRLPDPRDVRLRGFIPCALSVFDRPPTTRRVIEAIRGRSVLLLDEHDDGPKLAAVLITLMNASSPDARAAVRRCARPGRKLAAAAESRAAYDAGPLSSSRASMLWTEGRALALKGRHAAAERSLRAAACAFDRRRDLHRAANAALDCGRLLLSRGRAARARDEFERSVQLLQKAAAPGAAIEASIWLGIAETDLRLLAEAERTCRTALTAAAAYPEAGANGFAATALARALFWQGRYSAARSMLESTTPDEDVERCVRHWCLRARVVLATDSFGDARAAIARARQACAVACPAALDALIRTAEAEVQGRLGDLDALETHVRAGLASARAARQPVRTLILRLVHVQGLAACGQHRRAQKVVARLAALSGDSVPALLRNRLEALKASIENPQHGTRFFPEVSKASLLPAGESVAGDRGVSVRGLHEVISLAQEIDDEREALRQTAAAIRRHTNAAGVGIFGWKSGAVERLAESGSPSASIAQRAVDLGAAVGPEHQPRGHVDAAFPIHYLKRPVGAVAVRWAFHAPENAAETMAFGLAAASACGAIVYVLVERGAAAASAEDALEIVGVSDGIEEVRKAIRRAADAPFAVLIEGETGSGKELIARAIHRSGSRRERRFCALNCAALPEDLIDAELFGHAKGAFTGAAAERAGLFEGADGGTVFLDEVGEMSPRAQAKMLRVIQEGEVRRIGENFTRPFDARLIAATNRCLRSEAQAGRFRQDLLYRLDVIRMSVPPLRDRPEDIPLLAVRFFQQAASRVGSTAVLGPNVLAALARYDWPGNVRELQNALTALAVCARSRGVVGASELPAAIAAAARHTGSEPLDSARQRFERSFVRAALARAAGHRGRTAAALGLSRQGLSKLMHRLNLDA